MIRELTYRQLYVLVAAMLAITSCSSDDTFIHDGEKPMTFSVAAEQQTRATTYGDFTGEDFGVVATCYTGDYKTTTGITHMPNVKVTYDKDSKECATTGTYYWPDGNMHFAAYSPWVDDPSNAQMQVTLPAKPNAGYKFAGTVDGKKNHMFANEEYGSLAEDFTSGSVPIKFNHALTQVRFRAKMADGTADDIKLTINSLKIKNIRYRGTAQFTNDGTSWNTENRDSLWTVEKTFPVGSTYDAQHLDDYPVSTTGMTCITDTPKEFPGCLYLMPQQLYADTESQFLQQLQVTYTITSGGVEGAPITKTVPLKNVGSITQWTVNKSVLYTLIVEVGKPLTLTVTAQPWKLEEFTNEFSDVVTVNSDAHKIHWTDGTYSLLDNNMLVLLDDITKPAELKFTIDGPLGGTWQAIFVTKSGNPNAFTITPSEGAVGEECTLQISATGTNETNISNQAELRFVVHSNGKLLPVNILTLLDYGQNYTIVQNINK